MWDLVGRGAALHTPFVPFFGLIFLLTPGAGLGAWVGHGANGLSRCRVRLAILTGLSLLMQLI